MRSRGGGERGGGVPDRVCVFRSRAEPTELVTINMNITGGTEAALSIHPSSVDITPDTWWVK